MCDAVPDFPSTFPFFPFNVFFFPDSRWTWTSSLPSPSPGTHPQTVYYLWSHFFAPAPIIYRDSSVMIHTYTLRMEAYVPPKLVIFIPYFTASHSREQYFFFSISLCVICAGRMIRGSNTCRARIPFSKMSRLTLGPNKSLIQWMPGSFPWW